MQKQFERAAYSFSEFNMNYPNDSRLVDSTLFLAEAVGKFAAAEQACPIFESLSELLEENLPSLPSLYRENHLNDVNEVQNLSDRKNWRNGRGKVH